MLEEEIILKSGNKLNIQSPPFRLAMELIRCICKELRSQGIKIDWKEINSEAKALEVIIDVAMTLVGSAEFENVFWKLANSCLYNGERVTERLFDDRKDARRDFFEIEYKIIEACIEPFTECLLSGLEKAQVVGK